MIPEPATLDEVRDLSQNLYDQIWSDWYAAIPSATKASMIVTFEDVCAGFSKSKNILVNPIGEGNLYDPDIRDTNGWPIWKIQLVHEMLHEWQYKKPCEPSEAAVALHARLWKKFYGDGHGPDFFQAIIEKAPYFGMTAEELVKAI